MSTFVLVHGAWQGGWIWSRVAADLRTRGHQVHTPTLTGLGERRHLLSAGVDLSIHVEDVRLLLEYEGVTRAVLVGHGYGAVVAQLLLASGLDVGRIALIDPWPIEAQQSLAESLGGAAVARLNETRAMVGGTRVFEPPVTVLVAGLARRDADWVEERLVPFPAAALDGRMPAPRAPARIPVLAVRGTARDRHGVTGAPALLGSPVITIDAVHLAMLAKPEAVAELLDNFARQPASQFAR